jgi:two-component system cell cycle response regulator
VKILIADDDAVSRTMMRHLLMQGGYEVSAVSDGTAAVRCLMEDDGPRLLLLDWMMPGLDGPAVCRAIRTGARLAYIYITLLTSKDSKEDLVAGLEAGADDYLTKPCNLEELKARLRTGERILQLEDYLVTAREEMRFKATHDILTGLLNRGAILNELGGVMQEQRVPNNGFSILMCDVDHFKRINDTCGHPVGDEVLQEIGLRLRQAVRSSDSVGRFGGEEFFVLLKRCTEESLPSLAAMFCRAISSAPIQTGAGPMRVTMSVGALHVGPGSFTDGAERILQTVDEALYRAKSEGRDRVVITSLAANVLKVA